MVFFWGLVQVPSMCVWWVLFQVQFQGPETDAFFADMSQFTGSTVEVTFLRRSFGHGFKGLELGSLNSCIPCLCGWWLPRTTVATLVGHNCQKLSCQWKRCLAVLRGLELQHNCNITATRTATQPRNAVIYRVNLPCSMFKGFEPLRKRPWQGQKRRLCGKKQRCVAVLQFVLQLCCSRVAVKAHATQ